MSKASSILLRRKRIYTSTELVSPTKSKPHTLSSRASRLSTLPLFSSRWWSRSNSRRVSSTGVPDTATVWRSTSMVRGPADSSGSSGRSPLPRFRRAARMRASSSSMAKGLVI